MESAEDTNTGLQRVTLDVDDEALNVDDNTNTKTAMENYNQIQLSTNAKAFSIDSLLASKITQDEEYIDVDDNDDNNNDEDDNYGDNDDEERSEVPKIMRGNSSEQVEYLSADNDDTVISDTKCLTSASLEKTTCTLEMKELWKKFHELGTEMIITKSGRRMFPSLRVSFSDLEPRAHYQVYFDIAPVDNKRYRYAYHRSSWLVAGRGDPPIPRRCYTHPDGPFRGDSLQKQSISFEKVKVTNNLHDKWGYIILNSMHKYQPRIHLVKYEDKLPTVTTVTDLQTLDRKVFVFPETQFIGVTAYQNQLITKLKIDSNPFAKGFRDSARITQIDRESVDLLIKASRHGYHTAAASGLSHPCLPNIPLTTTIPNFQGGFLGKYPHVLNLPFQGLVGQIGISKDILKLYLDQINANHQAASSSKSLDEKHNHIRFAPYHR